MKQKEILFVVVSIFILVLIYIGFTIYHKSIASTISPDLSLQITPIAPAFDTATIEDLKKRNSVVPDFTQNTASQSVSPTVTPSPIPIPSPVATRSASPFQP